MTPPPGKLAGFVGRALIALGGLAFSAFFGGLAVLIVTAPLEDGHHLAGWLLRGFIALMFGALTAGGVWFTVKALRGDGEGDVPAAVTALCPGCGERGPAGEDACATCGAPGAAGQTWHALAPADGPGTMLFGAAVGASILCLGVFIMEQALFGDERRTLMILAYLGLAALLVLVGGLITFGALVGAREAWRARGTQRFQAEWHGAEAGGSRSVRAEARLEGGVLRAEGETSLHRPIDAALAAEASLADLQPPRRALAQVVAALHARGEAGLSLVERRSFVVEGGAAKNRDTSADVEITVATPRAAIDARDLVLHALADGSVGAVAAAAEGSSELAGALDTFAGRLADVEPDPRVLAALALVLRAAPAPGAPYRVGA
jgi:hypothetical protein